MFYEKHIERYFIRKVKEAGGLQRKYISPGCRGVPDRLCGFDGGKFAFVEFKRPGQKARPDQLREHTRWRKLKFLVFVIDTIGGVDDFIEIMTK
jgi:hypothetical protein